jgi:nucleoside-diphosphate-sugar epimerase
MTANVMVTGGMGFVGAHVGNQLLNKGHNPILFDISDDMSVLAELGIANQVETFQGDISEPTDITRAIAQNDITHIIHLAALLISQTKEHPRTTIDVNIYGMNNLLEAGRTFEDQIDRIVWASSETVYGPNEMYNSEGVSESDPVNPMTLYGASKLYCERQAELYLEKFDVSHVGLRPTVIYGPYSKGGDSSFISQLIEKPSRGEAVSINNGDLKISWLYVKDVARAFVRAMFVDEEAVSQRIYNVRGELATIREAAEAVSGLVPEADISLSEGQPSDWSIQNINTSAIEADLDFYPEYDLEAGIEDYMTEIN